MLTSAKDKERLKGLSLFGIVEALILDQILLCALQMNFEKLTDLRESGGHIRVLIGCL